MAYRILDYDPGLRPYLSDIQLRMDNYARTRYALVGDGDLGDFATKAAAFGWATATVDGHDFMDLENTFKALPLQPGKPTFIVCNTIKGKGVSFLENTVASHYWHVSKDDLEAGCRELEV